jgi:hypothetical protein
LLVAQAKRQSDRNELEDDRMSSTPEAMVGSSPAPAFSAERQRDR